MVHFPQIQGLGHSPTAQRYAIKDTEEATDYLNHPVLGSRLIEICHELLKLDSNDAHAIFGSPDHLKLHSSVTLFSQVKDTNPIFQSVLEKFFDGKPDHKTLDILNEQKRFDSHATGTGGKKAGCLVAMGLLGTLATGLATGLYYIFA